MFVVCNTVQDERRPMVARMWYCDIGKKGNVPNWAVREKYLDYFLVGGRPLPNRVHGVSLLSPFLKTPLRERYLEHLCKGESCSDDSSVSLVLIQ